MQPAVWPLVPRAFSWDAVQQGPPSRRESKAGQERGGFYGGAGVPHSTAVYRCKAGEPPTQLEAQPDLLEEPNLKTPEQSHILGKFLNM